MPITRIILIILVLSSPALLLWDGLITQGIVAGIAAVALAITARALRPVETSFLVSVISPLAAAAAVPALWMAFQALPLGVFAHPIWQSASAALGHPLAGAISIDPGASIIGLGQYLALMAVAFLSAAVGVDRQRAESILFALTAAALGNALTPLAHDLFFAGTGLGTFARAQAINCTSMGIIITAATCIRTIERRESRQSSPTSFFLTFLACCSVLLICMSALLAIATKEIFFATGYGFFAFAAVMTIRRFGLRLVGILGIAAPALGVAILLLAAHPVERGTSVLIAFAAPSSLATLSGRMLGDVPIVGIGAGTFAALAPIYREMYDAPSGPVAATAAANLAIELGQPVLWLIVITAAGAIVLLLKASLRRGRDAFYPAMGGSCLLSLLLLAFIDPGVLGTATSITAATVLGLALAQSKSRTT